MFEFICIILSFLWIEKHCEQVYRTSQYYGACFWGVEGFSVCLLFWFLFGILLFAVTTILFFFFLLPNQFSHFHLIISSRESLIILLLTPLAIDIIEMARPFHGQMVAVQIVERQKFGIHPARNGIFYGSGNLDSMKIQKILTLSVT